jgi:Poxvirus A32 protein
MLKNKFKDQLTDFYKIAEKSGDANKIKLDKNFKNHLIKPCSMITVIGPTGSGKTTSIIEFLKRKQEFYRIIIFSGSSTDEPLYNFLKKAIPDIELIDDPDKLPDLNEMNEEDKKQEKLIIFDDMINLPKKYLIKIQKWFNSARKWGFTCIALVQNYPDTPIQMRRNSQYFWIFRLNDNNTINQILKNHNTGDDKEAVKEAYFESTSQPKNFFMIDLTPNSPAKYRHNFTDVIELF